MASVTQRIASIKQPYGGYLPMKLFSKREFDDGKCLNENENIHSSLVGIAVDYLTRYRLEKSVDKAFHISCLGAALIGMEHKADALKSSISGLDDISIISACKLAGFDVCCRGSVSSYKPIEAINPDTATIENIRIMVMRNTAFWNEFGPIVSYEPTFEGGYTDVVTSGDGDYLCKDTLWDLKVLRSTPTSKHSLQILMYYVMGLHSVHDQYKSITNLGFYNPRLNVAYLCPVSRIPLETIEQIEKDVICYKYSNSASKENAISNPQDVAKDKEYTVADICKMTGLKKSQIYNDIHTGVLPAHKKGNKYLITSSDALCYAEDIKRRQKLLSILLIIAVIPCFIIIVMLVLLYI